MIRNTETHLVSVFKCNQWFSKTEGDGKLVREIPAETEGQQLLTSKCCFYFVYKFVCTFIRSYFLPSCCHTILYSEVMSSFVFPSGGWGGTHGMLFYDRIEVIQSVICMVRSPYMVRN